MGQNGDLLGTKLGHDGKDTPLSDIRVIEMGQLLAGPFAGQLLGDFGADVIKVEDPGVGDPMRQWGREKPHGLSLWWPVVARGKRSLTTNLRTKEGQDIIRDLVKESDILIENFRPGTLEKWGLDYETLKSINKKIIMVRVTGYGQSGPYSHKAGYGSIGEAMGGLRYVTGDPSTAPSRAGISIGDSLAATFAALGAMMALHSRDRTGVGQVVDVAIYEAVLAMMESLIPEFTLANYIRERTGSILPNVAPSNIYPTKDAALILIAANQDSVFSRLCDAMEKPEYVSDPRFSTHSSRGAHQGLLDEIISEWTSRHSTSELEVILDKNGVPQGKIFRAPDMLSDPHFAARNAIVGIEHPDFGSILMQNVAPKLSDTPGYIRWAGPELGAHTTEILQSLLGYSPNQIKQLSTKGVI
ncbi:CaiB/BaiF CoA transferase family protein [Acidithrix ferrooxidans]|uniref:Succinyl-CoA:(R)-benzylsuccinate CoA-transferase subunit BbsF n=1 Tax=Acidithrix ferrooxidans TaxID=1280514 RepID=A0A0D8HKG9_9ACTN|nr:CoA transferase [Acidithrix ferrooxidans]KJF18267.1 succinyl-CoA:(R)-benzylsuccinate CoA-transferase subunit BbsF [Acidithrix ferrooxidans]